MNLKGRVALVTGAGRGIGAAVAAALAAEGAAVYLVARTLRELEETAERVRSKGGHAELGAGDVADRAAVGAVVRDCSERLGEPLILVNAAGVYGPIGPLWENDPEAWWRAQEVNVRGTMLTCSAVLPAMLAAAHGRIINFSGGGATSPLPRFSAYAASKAAVVRLTETLAEEVRGRGITVNAIAPGAVDTRLQDQVLAAGDGAGELYERMRRMRETGEGAVPAELAASLAAWLASNDASTLTGKLISAPHDGWQQWDAARLEELASSPWLTLRRLDPFTLRPLVEKPAAGA